MKAWRHLKYSFFSLFLSWQVNSQYDPCSSNDVMTSSGPVRGTELNFDGHIVMQYLGLPFAKPPVGDLRFKKPQPVEPWKKTFVADKMSPACIQFTTYPFPWYDFDDGKSEDCLYLNIWVPKSSSNDMSIIRYSVMFWIYGGGFNLGSNRKPTYAGQTLAALGEVIVVTINYRVGVFGFFNSGTEAAPGNMAIYDMLEALKWVNKNIAAFGGDPDKVTLVGESAGSIAVGLLCISPLTKGLFKRVIMQSGSPAWLTTENNTVNFAKSQKLAEALGCANETISIYHYPEIVVDCMRNIDAFEIAKTENSFHPTSTRSFLPNYGDEILPQNTRIALIEGNFHNVDVLTGNNRDEGVYEITSADPDTFGFFGKKDPTVNKTYGEFLTKKILGDFDNTGAVNQYYLGNLREDQYYQIRAKAYEAGGDYNILCPNVYFAETYSKAGNNVYYYYFVHRPSNTPWAKWTGVVHYEEVQFVFGVPVQKPENFTKMEVQLSRRMIRIWSNFIQHGNPGKKRWPSYSRENPVCVKLDNKSRLRYVQGPHKKNCDFFREYFGFT